MREEKNSCFMEIKFNSFSIFSVTSYNLSKLLLFLICKTHTTIFYLHSVSLKKTKQSQKEKRKNMKKKIVTSFVVLTMTLVVGCGTTQNTTSESSVTTSSSTSIS